MEKSTHFHQPQVVAESVVANTSEQGQAGNIQFDIAAVYVPGPTEADDNQTADNAAGDSSPVAQASTPMTNNAASRTGPMSPSKNAQPNVNAAQNRPDTSAARMRGR